MSDETFGIDPSVYYRKTDPKTRQIIGLAATAIDEAIKNGDLEPPEPITENGRATGWQGATLIKMIRKRQERAAAKHALRMAATAAAPAPSKKKPAPRSSARGQR